MSARPALSLSVSVDLAAHTQLPAIYYVRSFVEAGGLMSYRGNEAERFRRLAIYVDKILKGANPADLPVEQPTTFELIVNLKTAQALGLTIPPTPLQADEVIRLAGRLRHHTCAADQHPHGLRSSWTSRRTRSECRRSAHDVHLLGPPGAGKSMLARQLTTILPAMTLAEALDTTRIHSVAGLTGDRTSFVRTRLFQVLHPRLVEVCRSGNGRVSMLGNPAGAPGKHHASAAPPTSIAVLSRSSLRFDRVSHQQRKRFRWAVPLIASWPWDPMTARG